MDLYERQQFDFLLHTALERLGLRLQERYRGAAAALEQLGQKGDSDTISPPVQEFVDALFADFLLDNAAGACFVLQGLAEQPVPVKQLPQANLEQALVQLAKTALGRLLDRKLREHLAQLAAFE